MTTYATPLMVRNTLRVLNQSPRDTVRIDVDSLDDEADIQPHIDDSDARVATYCSGKPIPVQLMAGLSAKIAAFFLVVAYRGSADFQTDNDPVLLLYRDAMSVLEDIGTGKINPVEPDDPDNPVADLGPGATYQPPTPCLVTTDILGRPTVVDQPWGYPGVW